MTDPLAGLRPLHTPDPVAWWPLAPGWWLLIIAVLIVIGWGVLQYRKGARRRMALALLRGLEQDGAPAGAVNVLLKRYALAAYPRKDVASLTGAAWVAFLREQAPKAPIPDGPATELTQAAYAAPDNGPGNDGADNDRPHNDRLDNEGPGAGVAGVSGGPAASPDLFDAARRWLRHNRPQRTGGTAFPMTKKLSAKLQGWRQR